MGRMGRKPTHLPVLQETCPYRGVLYAERCDGDNVRWVVKVGTAPSAGGARAHIANIVTHLATHVSSWEVALYRDITSPYMLKKET